MKAYLDNITAGFCRINNAEGYVLKRMPDVPVQYGNTNSQYSFFYETRDHLGNIISVWDAGHQWLMQQVTYWPSGMPFTWRGEQHVTEQLMNGHEYIPMHGYDMYDFGFRHYYATIGRFTSPDPLAERTPWQSPYVYASNNFTGEIDWMGMEPQSCNLTYVNGNGIVVFHDPTHPNQGVYLVDDDWDGTYNSLTPDVLVGFEEKNVEYVVGKLCSFKLLDGAILSSEFASAFACEPEWTIQQTTINSENNDEDFTDWLGFISTSLDLLQCNPLYWIGKNNHLYNFTQRQTNYVYNRSYNLAWKRLKSSPLSLGITGVSTFFIIEDIYQNGLTWGNTADVILLGVSLLNPTAATIVLGITVADVFYGEITGQSLSAQLNNRQIIPRKW